MNRTLDARRIVEPAFRLDDDDSDDDADDDDEFDDDDGDDDEDEDGDEDEPETWQVSGRGPYRRVTGFLLDFSW